MGFLSNSTFSVIQLTALDVSDNYNKGDTDVQVSESSHVGQDEDVALSKTSLIKSSEKKIRGDAFSSVFCSWIKDSN